MEWNENFALINNYELWMFIFLQCGFFSFFSPKFLIWSTSQILLMCWIIVYIIWYWKEMLLRASPTMYKNCFRIWVEWQSDVNILKIGSIIKTTRALGIWSNRMTRPNLSQMIQSYHFVSKKNCIGIKLHWSRLQIPRLVQRPLC